MDGTGETDACRPIQTAGSSMAEAESHRLTDIVRNNEGVWLSQRLFYIIGSLSLLSIITIVLEIAFYVYFHWIL